MPYPSEHALRVSEPKKYTKLRRQNNKYGEGIDVIFGVLPDGKTEVQAIRFKKDKFTIDKVKTWLENHEEYKGEIEPAISNDSNESQIVMRFDTFNLDSTCNESKEGYLNIDAPVSKVGVFPYRMPDGSIIRELRHPKEVFNPDSMSSLKLKPVTSEHPYERRVDSNSVNAYMVGYTGEKVRQIGNELWSNFSLTHNDGIKAAKQGKRKLSTGYETVLDHTPGTYNGQEYDAIQTNIRYNHLAICDSPRLGEELSFNIDSYDSKDGINDDKTIINVSQKQGVKNMPTIKLDGIDYEASQEVINALQKATVKIDSLTDELKNKDTELSKKNAEIDQLKENHEKFKTDSADAFNKKVKERIDLLNTASVVFKKEDNFNTDSLNDIELKKAIIIKRYPNSQEKIDSSDENYINARYDLLTETLDTDIKNDALNSQRASTHEPQTTNVDSQEAARDRLKERMSKAYLNNKEDK